MNMNDMNDMPFFSNSGDSSKNQSDDFYNDFWDKYQQNGERQNYDYGFAGVGWTEETFKPNYDIVPLSAVSIFYGAVITNLKKTLENLGVKLDFSKTITIKYPFQSSFITDVGILDVSSGNNLVYFLYNSKKLKNIEKLILNQSGKQTFDATLSFGACDVLEHMIVEGVIGQNNFNVQWSPLDVESLVSIMYALADKSADTSGTEWKIKIGATNMAKLTEEQLQIAYNKGWAVE